MLNNRLNLQLFADEGKTGGNEETTGEPQNITLTEEELQKRLQTEADKRVTQALKTAHEKWQGELEAKLKTEREEAERLAKLSAAEKEQELLKKQQEEIEKREAELARRELELKTVDLLTEAKLDLRFKPFIMGLDEEKTKERLEQFKTLWQDALNVAVEAKFKSNGRDPHRDPTPGGQDNPWKRETFNLTEQARIIRENPELARTLQAQAKS